MKDILDNIIAFPLLIVIAVFSVFSLWIGYRLLLKKKSSLIDSILSIPLVVIVFVGSLAIWVWNNLLIIDNELDCELTEYVYLCICNTEQELPRNKKYVLGITFYMCFSLFLIVNSLS